ncbi:hypothetical protein D3C81_2048250 [compost metagenome]
MARGRTEGAAGVVHFSESDFWTTPSIVRATVLWGILNSLPIARLLSPFLCWLRIAASRRSVSSAFFRS